mgnify:CR=1 FL=1
MASSTDSWVLSSKQDQQWVDFFSLGCFGNITTYLVHLPLMTSPGLYMRCPSASSLIGVVAAYLFPPSLSRFCIVRRPSTSQNIVTSSVIGASSSSSRNVINIIIRSSGPEEVDVGGAHSASRHLKYGLDP